MKRHHPIIISMAVALCAVSATSVPAQVEGRDNGFYLGLRVASSDLHIDENANDTFRIDSEGSGLMLLAGYSFNRVFSLELDFGGSAHNTSDFDIDAIFGTLQLFAHYRFRPGHAFRPFVKGGLGAYGFGVEDKSNKVTIGGGGIPLGGGFDYFFNRRFSLGLDLTHNIIEYDRVDINLGSSSVSFDIDEDGAQSALGIAFQFYF